MAIHYEWDCEEVVSADTEQHEAGEVIDHHHSASYRDALAMSRSEPGDGLEWRLVLVRDNDDTQKGQRSWAYLESGVLPEFFEDAHGQPIAKVPKRFFDEMSKEAK